MISVIIGQLDPSNQVAEIYYYMLKTEKDKRLRKVLDNKDNIIKMNYAMQKVWERKKSDEEEAMEQQQA